MAQAAHDNLVGDYDHKIQRQSAVLDSIKSELVRGRARLSELTKKEGLYLEKIEALEKNIDIAGHYLAKIDAGIDASVKRIALLDDSLANASHALESRLLKMHERLRTMYKTGKLGFLQILLSSSTPADVLYRVRYFQELKNYDRMLVQSIDSTRTIIRMQTLAQQEELERLVALKNEKDSEQNALKSERQKHGDMLQTVQGEKEAYLQMVKELEQAQAELAALLKTLEKKRKQARIESTRTAKVEFEKRKGSLPWPVQGEIVKKFGTIVHPVYKTVTASTGIDIAAKKGTKVFCVAPGRVDYVGWMRGYGKFVIISHSGGFCTIYAHLEEISVAADDELTGGQVLGIVGETGSLTGAKLHFQVRKESDALDPQIWLEKMD